MIQHPRFAALGGSVALSLMLAACGGAETAASDPQTNFQAFVPALGTDAAALPPLPDALPLAPVASGPARLAPAAAALPAGRDLGWADAGEGGYAWIDRADALLGAIGDAPPDYSFGYDDGVEPWAWDTAGDYSIYAEPIDDGLRYYYYEPGADAPFFVRDPQYGYGYSDGRIVSVWDAGGALLPYAGAARFAPYAARYYDRGVGLRRAAWRGDRRPVAAPLWAARAPYAGAARQRWAVARERNLDWRRWAERREARELRRRIAPERVVRADAGRRFAGWREAGFRGEPPRLYAGARAARRDAALDAQIERRREQLRAERLDRGRLERRVAVDRGVEPRAFAAVARGGRAADRERIERRVSDRRAVERTRAAPVRERFDRKSRPALARADRVRGVDRAEGRVAQRVRQQRQQARADARSRPRPERVRSQRAERTAAIRAERQANRAERARSQRTERARVARPQQQAARRTERARPQRTERARVSRPQQQAARRIERARPQRVARVERANFARAERPNAARRDRQPQRMQASRRGGGERQVQRGGGQGGGRPDRGGGRAPK